MGLPGEFEFGVELHGHGIVVLGLSPVPLISGIETLAKRNMGTGSLLK
jgi:hypothetical protein